MSHSTFLEMAIINEMRFAYNEDESVKINLRVLTDLESNNDIQVLTTWWTQIPPYNTIKFAHDILEKHANWTTADILFSIPAQIVQQESRWMFTITNTTVVFDANRPKEILISIELGRM